MEILATIILAYYLLRQIAFVVEAHKSGHAFIWTIVGGVIAASLLIPLWLVWV